MKSVIQFWALLLLVGTAMGLKDPICGHKPFAGGNGLKPFFEGDDNIKCKAGIPSFSYNLPTSRCVGWKYGGCFGNANRFQTKEECEAKCKE